MTARNFFTFWKVLNFLKTFQNLKLLNKIILRILKYFENILVKFWKSEVVRFLNCSKLDSFLIAIRNLKKSKKNYPVFEIFQIDFFVKFSNHQKPSNIKWKYFQTYFHVVPEEIPRVVTASPLFNSRPNFFHSFNCFRAINFHVWNENFKKKQSVTVNEA